MYAAKIDGATRCLRKPSNMTDEQCHALHIRDYTDQDGLPVMLSAWTPAPEDLRVLVAGGSVLLGILGTVHPPVFLTVSEPGGM